MEQMIDHCAQFTEEINKQSGQNQTSDFSQVRKITMPDYLTPGGVGGVHSDYIYLGDDIAGNSAFEFIDVQKLNP